MNILPSEIIQWLENFRPLMRLEVFETFTLLITGLLVGEAKHGTVWASVFAPADYQPARISDFFTTHRVSPQKLIAKLTELVVRSRYGSDLPKRMFWIADSTNTEKPYADVFNDLANRKSGNYRFSNCCAKFNRQASRFTITKTLAQSPTRRLNTAPYNLSYAWTRRKRRMNNPQRGEVWLADLGYAGKTRSVLILSIPAQDQDRALVTLAGHTTTVRGTRFEVAINVYFLKPGAFECQNLVTVQHAKLL